MLLHTTTQCSITNALWSLQEVNHRAALTLSQKFQLPEILAQILVIRGIKIENMINFLNPRIQSSLPDPLHLIDMDKAILRIIHAINHNERIAIFGDYDVDGVSSSALIHRYLKEINVNSIIYIPNRINEGYGLNSNALLQLKKLGIDLCIAVDCGTISYKPIADAQQVNLDIIVIDHHLGANALPCAVAIVNPNRLDENSPYNYLAAVGVTFLLLVALNRALRMQGFFLKQKEPNLFNLLDLVALGTVCDVMQMIELNRAFVLQGLKVMAQKKNIGLSILFNYLGILEKPNASRLGFSIGPCINASGRIGDESLGTKLLTTNDIKEAHTIALKLIESNKIRQSLEREAILEAMIQAKKYITLKTNFIMVLGKWHQGIIGIIASRLREQFHLPTIVISMSHGIGKASCRSIVGIDIGAAILSAKEMNHIIEGGGHNMAAGFSVAEEKISELHDFFAARFSHSTQNKILKADLIISIQAINLSLWNQIKKLEPFGPGNPEPRFILQGIKIKQPSIIGKDHIRCNITDNTIVVKAIAFRAVNTELGFAIMQGNVKEIFGKLLINYWHGNEYILFSIEDLLTLSS
ncbi:single-stranded-DNA-specific exonuclease RecJ [Wolbachia endosymbiont of Howardula sp.]|uniref:single-stranded-DNA-specific exonuclease RecJ n=1 Tax=Wolbachia endosymbiont of Howardula sp. TaxID=2916816 RepID=UPI00217E90F1|nr:single-stranded-DNA-specific exonuclease RecJ [Wolbachia endosymbiont of Howardula sp.]UWI83225.1 single-stranded-DNA-specific exonuclease RecJ [Wolbachia endosymbiont of Howardula sp.]